MQGDYFLAMNAIFGIEEFEIVHTSADVLYIYFVERLTGIDGLVSQGTSLHIG